MPGTRIPGSLGRPWLRGDGLVFEMSHGLIGDFSDLTHAGLLDCPSLLRLFVTRRLGAALSRGRRIAIHRRSRLYFPDLRSTSRAMASLATTTSSAMYSSVTSRPVSLRTLATWRMWSARYVLVNIWR